MSKAGCTALRWAGGLAVLAVPAVHTACSESSFSSTLPEDQGDYTASVAVDGENNIQLSGNAVFGTTTNTSGISLNVLYLWTGNPDGNVYNVVWLQRRNLDLLETGDYDINDVDGSDPPADDFVGLYAFADATGTAATFHSVTGTLTISTAETLELTGTFELIGAFVQDAYHAGVVGDTVQVSGTFRAVAGTIY